MFDFQIETIDTSKWKYFKIGQLFDFSKGKDSSPKSNDSNVADGVKCIVAKNNNCGVGGWKLNPKWVWYKEALVIIGQGDGGAGLSYYVDPPFCANLCVWVLTPKDNVYFNKYVGLFLSTMLSKYKNVFSHSKSINLKILNELTIKLPVDSNGDPDWKFMEEYIKSLNSKINNYFLNELKNFQDEIIYTSKWKYFKIGQLFDFSKGKDSSPKSNDSNVADGVKCIVAKNNNCGVGGWKLNPKWVWYKEALVIIGQGDGGAGLSYYVDPPFCANLCVWVLTPKDNVYFNKYVGLFLSTMLSKYKNVFSHSKSINLKILNELTIKLPVDSNGDPDWKFMEEYIKSLPYSKYI